MSYRIDGLQYANWSEKIFRQMRQGRVDAVHVTIAYHETFRETVLNFEQWNRWFEDHPDLIMKGLCADDIDRARQTERRYFSDFRTRARLRTISGSWRSCTRSGRGSCS